MKSFSELTSASQVNNEDLLAISQTSGSGYASKKTTVKDITDKSNLNLAEEYDSTSSYAVGDYCIYESILYKCIGTTTGTFDSTKWTSVVVTDEVGSGGGGSSTLVGLSDTNIVNPSNGQILKFNSTNNKWENDVEHIYSTTEHNVGKWIDGKTIYEQTFTNLGLTLPQTQSNWTDTHIPIPSGLDTIISANAIDTNKQCYPLSCAIMSTTQTFGMALYFFTYRNIEIITIQYTKSS